MNRIADHGADDLVGVRAGDVRVTGRGLALVDHPGERADREPLSGPALNPSAIAGTAMQNAIRSRIEFGPNRQPVDDQGQHQQDRDRGGGHLVLHRGHRSTGHAGHHPFVGT
jgi:hypothetical protein